jgi:hypothetical protein
MTKPDESAAEATPQAPARLQAQVAQWLLSESWQLTARDHPEALWLLEARDAADRFVLVCQKKNRSDQVVMEATVGISPEHREQLAALPAEERREILWELRFTLLQMGLEFHAVQEPLERVSLGQRIYEDGLGKDAFLQRISLVRNGILAVVWTISRRLHGVMGSAETGGLGIN